MVQPAAVHEKAISLARLVVRMTSLAGSGHPSSALSLAHIVTYLMYHEMHWDPAQPDDPAADRLVLSEGHAVPIIYAALADLGAMVGKDPARRTRLTVDDLDQLRALQSPLDGHPNPAEGVPFFDAATGSLGQGLSVAAGLALAARLDGSPRRVFCLVGDGESREGQIWEAVDFAAERGLTNLCAIFNCNGQGQAGPVSPQQSAERLSQKLAAFGWNVSTCDGHDPAQIGTALARLAGTDRPLALVARTVKGWGVEELQKGNWHGKPLPEAELATAEARLDALAARLVSGPERLGRPSPPRAGFQRAIPRVDPREVRWPSFEQALRSAGLGTALERGSLSTRRAYGAGLKVAGDLLPQIVCLDGDVSNSTFSEIFARAHPQRFIECRIAEQNMISAAVGLSAAGFLPFVNTFSKFFARAYDQIEMANISRANLRLVGSHSGVSLAADGPSQMSLPDVAFFRAFTTVRGDDRESPLCWIYHPADAVAAYHCTRLLTMHSGMAYMRTHRPDVPLIYPPDTRFEPGGFHVLADGDELAIISAGFMIHVARQAVAALARQNHRVALIDAYCLPIDGERLRETLRRTGSAALVVEDNYGGGLGAAVAEIAARAGDLTVQTLCCQRLPKSARTAEEILEYCGVSAGQIADHALALLRRPRTPGSPPRSDAERELRTASACPSATSASIEGDA
jgi:transketolase